jgi:hypothetical protein
LQWTAGQETTARTSLNKTNFTPLLNGRLVGKSRGFESFVSHQYPKVVQPLAAKLGIAL